MKKFQIGILGLGTVGTGVIEILREQSENFKKRFGVSFQTKKVLVKNINKKRSVDLQGIELTEKIEDIIGDPDIDIVIELIGGKTIAKKAIIASLEAKKNVISANKDLIADDGRQLADLAEKNNVGFYYEAAVAGAIPILRALENSLDSDRIESINGIINGTSNFILSKMRQQKMSYRQALSLAQELGFAEADPTNDVDGIDAAYKLQILADFAFGKQIEQKDIQMSGIRTVTQQDLNDVSELGYEIKLLANASLIDGRLQFSVGPTLVPKDHPLASVQNENNAIFVSAAYAGGLMFYGPGAGKLPTANSVIADLLELTSKAPKNPRFNSQFKSDTALAGPKNRIASRYIVFKVADRPGAMHKLSGFFLMSNINFRNIRQYDPIDGSTRVVIITYPASDAQLNPVKTTIRQAKGVEIVHEFKLLERK
ncbi:homoserine dehydrogenase [Oenococcus alcoholitolerans]|uniref:homoserine dehydrogenase n=1 Tax=Oenococcus alcoholitolerans TaxID=931074 RepID=UPI003F6E5798